MDQYLYIYIFIEGGWIPFTSYFMMFLAGSTGFDSHPYEIDGTVREMVSPRSLTFVGATLIWGSLVSSASCAPLVFWLSHFLRNSSSFVEEWCINTWWFCLMMFFLSDSPRIPQPRGSRIYPWTLCSHWQRCEELTWVEIWHEMKLIYNII